MDQITDKEREDFKSEYEGLMYTLIAFSNGKLDITPEMIQITRTRCERLAFKIVTIQTNMAIRREKGDEKV